MNSLWDGLIDKRYPKPANGAQPAAVVAATASPAGESEADIRARILAEQAENVRAIEAVCAMAGRPMRAKGFISEGKTLSQVVGILSGLAARMKH